MMALMIMAAVIITSAVPALAEIQYDKTKTEYVFDSSTDSEDTGVLGPNHLRDIYMYGLPGKLSNVKSSNPSVVEIRDFSNANYTYNYFRNSPTENSRSSYIDYKALKPGTSTISFKVGSKTYKSTIKVLKYVNPLSSLTITGFNGGKTFHTKFNKRAELTQKVNKSVSNAKVTVKAKSGWVVTDLSVYDYKTRKAQEYRYYDGKSGRSSMSLNNIRLWKGDGTLSPYTNIYIRLRNKSNGGVIPLYLHLE